MANPFLLELVTRDGPAACGRARFLLVRYGRFFVCVAPIPGGHVSAAIDADADPLPLAAAIQETIAAESETALTRRFVAAS